MPRLPRRPSIGVELAAVFDMVGVLLRWISLSFAAPALVALLAAESPLPFLLSGLATAAAGAGLVGLARRRGRDEETLGVREGFLLVAVLWLLVPTFGALPFLIGGVDQLDRPVDAYFEAASGFTATGASVLTDVERLGRAMQFWRQLSHWLGGMGIIVLAIAVLPRLRVGGRQLLQHELPGPTEIERLGTTVRETAQRLWKLYVGLTAAGMLLLAATGWTGIDPAMDLFQAFSYATSAVALGGFSPRSDSAQGLAPATQWILCALMVVAGVNFLRLFRLIVRREVRAVARDDELRWYLGLLAMATVVIAIELFSGDAVHGFAGVRHAAFQTVSVMTTTGFATLDWAAFGGLAALTLLLLMLVGASAGSATGSIKVVRHLMLFRLARRELEQAVHPEAMVNVRVSGATISDRALRSAVMFVILYLAVLATGALALLLDARRVGADLGGPEAVGAAAACLGNVGPAFGAAGPFGSYAGFSDLSTVLLTMLMVLGRVEIVPIAVLATRTFWRA